MGATRRQLQFIPPRFMKSVHPHRWLGAASGLAALLVQTGSAAQSGVNAAEADAATTAESESGVSVEVPELIRFVEAPYPEEAERQGLEGEVVLGLTIDAAGKVVQAEVVQGAGHGFDEAARTAALAFEFTPAKRAGVPIPVRILYRYRFELAEPEVTQPEPAPPSQGALEGVLRIAGAETPLVGATVLVRDEQGRAIETRSDAQGRFSLTELQSGQYSIRVSPPGFAPVETSEQVVAGEAVTVTLRLSPETDAIEIVVEGERPAREVTRRSLEREQIRRVPGASGDALLSIQSLPGVARPPGLSGLLIVRGSAPQDTEVFIDGSAAPGIYHFGGLRSVIPTELLDRLDFYPGNFSARYGRVMGGIVDVGLRKPDDRCTAPYMKDLDVEKHGCFHGLAQVDLIDGRVLLQGPLSKDWSFAVGARRSWVDAWIGPVLESFDAGVTTAPVYYDYQAIVDHTPDRDSRLSLRLYGSDDRVKLLLDEPFANDPGFGGNVSFAQGFHTFQGLYETQLSRSVNLYSSLSVGRSRLAFGIGTLRFELTNYPVQARTELGWNIAKGVKINAGMDMLLGNAELSIRSPRPPDPNQPDSGPFTTRPPIERDVEVAIFRPAWYTELELQPTDRLRLIPSARVDNARDTGRADLSPRLNARYELVTRSDAISGPGFLSTALKAGIGRYHQPPQFNETDTVFGTPGLISNEAVHYALGFEQEFTDAIELSSEGFYKDMTDLVVTVPEEGGTRYANLGDGYVVGWENLLEYKPDGRFFGWIAYTLSRSVRGDASGAERLFEWDQTHNLVVLGNYELGRGWNLGARFRLVSGRPSTPVIAAPNLPALYAADASAYAPLQGELNSVRLPAFHQLDVRIEKAWQFEVWRLTTYLDVWNAYNNPSVEGVSYSYNYAEQAYSTGVPILPSLGVRGEF